MAISYLTSSASNALGPATSLTYAIDCTGSDFLIVGCSYNGSGSITSVTYNGTAMTQAVSDSNTPGSNTSFSAIYYLYAPSTGSNNVVVTFNSAPSSRIRSAAACYSGVDTSGQPDAIQKNYTASGTTLSCTTSTVAANNYVVTYSTGVDTSSATFTITSGGTSRVSGSGNIIFDEGPNSASSSVTSSISHNGSSQEVYIMTMSIKPAGGSSVNSGFFQFM